tara:strand:+ start:626 stop:811 length:186 start_codon:yes stop_codon:yes gene_type:complete
MEVVLLQLLQLILQHIYLATGRTDFAGHTAGYVDQEESDSIGYGELYSNINQAACWITLAA